MGERLASGSGGLASALCLGGTRTCIHTPGAPLEPSELSAERLAAVLEGAALVYFDGRLTEAALLLAREARQRGIPVCTRSVQVVTPNLFRDFGGKLRFSGQAATVRCYENNPLVRKALEEPGLGRVLVVDGGGSLRCALLGDMLAESGVKNGYSGLQPPPAAAASGPVAAAAAAAAGAAGEDQSQQPVAAEPPAPTRTATSPRVRSCSSVSGPVTDSGSTGTTTRWGHTWARPPAPPASAPGAGSPPTPARPSAEASYRCPESPAAPPPTGAAAPAAASSLCTATAAATAATVDSGTPDTTTPGAAVSAAAGPAGGGDTRAACTTAASCCPFSERAAAAATDATAAACAAAAASGLTRTASILWDRGGKGLVNQAALGAGAPHRGCRTGRARPPPPFRTNRTHLGPALCILERPAPMRRAPAEPWTEPSLAAAGCSASDARSSGVSMSWCGCSSGECSGTAASGPAMGSRALRPAAAAAPRGPKGRGLSVFGVAGAACMGGVCISSR
ncbi:putative regulator of ribonuclease activity [Tetrabaena socialis]|uniref:Putative regulator of ribonuclease activity n=1 Tax=Tetrabaena socialis TaxID=47790 RepID=A0A2J7ZWM8_9CHLO|nr:putative regulator of ribonuclease activity [Tetrabaena socialis]|eukprot:PNH04666.1 putative regulator of ribonuclease activity [Tetrabaena socialis]